jgi:flagellar basal-body rod protein FlgB
MADFFSDTTSLALQKSLDGIAYRHRVIADNIANVETPGFKRSDVLFEEKLKSAISSSDSLQVVEDRLDEIQPEAEQDTTSPARPDGNNVSIDKEMADMTKNTMQYEAIIQLMSLRGSMLRSVINEGRR